MFNNDVEVIEVRPFESKTMVAFVDVRIGMFMIPGTKIMTRENGVLWVSFPSIEKDGKYFEAISIDSRSLERQIKAEIIRQYKEKTRTNNAFGDATPAQPFGFIESAPQPNAL